MITESINSVSYEFLWIRKVSVSVRIRFSVWLVSGNAKVLMQLSVFSVPHPEQFFTFIQESLDPGSCKPELTPTLS